MNGDDWVVDDTIGRQKHLKLDQGIRIQFRILLSIMLTLGFLSTKSQAARTSPENKQVLLLHSYHPGLLWTDAVHQGFQKILVASAPEVELFVEYLDTKRHPSKSYLEAIKPLLQYKYANVPLDAVVTSDDNALIFALENRAVLFARSPIVFCGVNSLEVYQNSDHYRSLMTNITGVVEDIDVASTMKIALTLQPDTSLVYVINDHTTTGQSNKQHLLRLEQHYKQMVKFVYFEDLAMADLLHRIARLPSHSIILLMSYTKDAAGRTFTYRQSIDLIASQANAPIYGVWSFYLGRGIVGGMITDGESQGKMAAELLLKVLAGTPIDQVPIVDHSPNHYIFDYRQMARFNIPIDKLPPGSRIINQPSNFYHKYRAIIWTAVVIVAVQALIIIILALNIGLRHRAEADLKNQKDAYQRIFHNIQDVYFEADANGRILEISPSIVQELGYRRDDLIGAYLDDIFIETAARRTLMASLNEHSRVTDYEIQIKHHDSSSQFCAINATLLENAPEGPTRIVGSLRNIQSRKQAENERTLLTQRLHRAEKMEAIGTLAGGVAHDLNNILGGIVTYPDLLLMRLPDDSPLLRPLRAIRKSGHRAAAIVQDMLALARRSHIAKETVDCNQVISDYLSSPEHDRLMQNHPKVLIQTALQNDLNCIEGSTAHLSKVVMNLVANAAESIADEGVIHIQTSHQRFAEAYQGFERVPAGDYVVITIQDSGSGIPAEHLESIFEPFYTTKKLGRSGTGLGMSVVWGTVHDHQGFIDVSSQQNVGTTIYIYMPAAGPRIIPEAAQSQSPQELKGHERVLVVDDVETQRDVATAILADLGYKVVAVESGQAAVDHLKRHEVDLVVLDMIMEPGIDGLETLRQIHQFRPSQRAVIASGFSKTERVKKAQSLGAINFVAKPYAMQTLAAAVRSALDEPDVPTACDIEDLPAS